MKSKLLYYFFLMQGIFLEISGTENSTKTEQVTENVMRTVRWELHRLHGRHPPILERDCYLGDCHYDRALKIIQKDVDATMYWNLLICVKFGMTCPRNGQWSEWQPWKPCSAYCVEGERLRRRTCDSPLPMYGGLYCKGEDYELGQCFFDAGAMCAFDPAKRGVWTEWQPWKECIGDCGEGLIKRYRICTPTYLSIDCESVYTEARSCPLTVCSQDGTWSDWLPWSLCTTEYTCGTGARLRTRECASPPTVPEGKDCMGPSSEMQECTGKNCKESPPELAHLLPISYIRYQPIKTTEHLNVYLKFLPNSDDGMIFQYSTVSGLHEAVAQGSVVIKKPELPDFISSTGAPTEQIEPDVPTNRIIEEDYVYATLESRDLISIYISLNNSNEIYLPLHGVRHGRWNELRITILSDMIWVRLNDGENIEARMQDYPNVTEEVVATSNDTSYISSIITSLTNTVVGSVQDLMKPQSRPIFAEFNGEFGLGSVRDGFPGFRGYLSKFIVNNRLYGFKKKPPSEIQKIWHPMRASRISYGIGHSSFDAMLTPFGTREYVELPLVISWWNDLSDRLLKHKPIGSSSNEIATFEIILKPECKTGLFFFLQGAGNRLTHWKLSVIDKYKIQLTMSYSGELTMVKSEDDLRIGSWNRVILRLARRGIGHLQVNNKTYDVKMPMADVSHLPGSKLLIGGYGKDLAHSKVLGNVSEEVIEQLKSFEGYIYSLRQNDQLYLIHEYPQLNSFHMYSSSFMSEITAAKSVLFAPSTPSPSLGAVTDYVGMSSGTVQTVGQDSDKQTLHCISPIMKQAIKFPNFTWLRNDQKIQESSNMWTKVLTSDQGHISSLYLGTPGDSSRDLSGVYQCVISYYGRQFLIITFLVAVLNDELTHWGSGGFGSILYGYSTETLVLIAAGGVIGGVVVFLGLISVIRFIIRKIKERRIRAKDKKREENIPLIATEKKNIPGMDAKGKARFSSKVKNVNLFKKKEKPPNKEELTKKNIRIIEEKEEERAPLLEEKEEDVNDENLRKRSKKRKKKKPTQIGKGI